MRRFIVLMLMVNGIVQGNAVEAQHVDDQIAIDSDDWPWWRGRNRDGVANAAQRPPSEWSESKNVAWKSLIPGRGHSSPIVVGSRIFLTTSDEEHDSQSVLCYDRTTGKMLWSSQVHRDGGMRKNKKSSAASTTVACDGERIYVGFANGGAIFVTALDLDGHQLWQTRLCDYLIHQGYGASPTVYQSLVLVAADSDAGGAVAGLNRASGQIAWKRERPKLPNYTSPIVLHAAGRDQLVLTGCDLVSSFDPLTGNPLWEVKATTTECVTSAVTDGTHIFASGGYPRNFLQAIAADGSGKIAWDRNDRIYVPSMIASGSHLFGVYDAGVAACWRCDTGEQRWKSRLGGTFSASPILVGAVIYATNEEGETFVYDASGEKFVQLAKNKLGDEAFATLTICGDKIYTRVAHVKDDQRQEMLYCLSEEQ
ncbi:MAG: PQQ-binding-like beta-propeller repeat protein [Pirellulales bacterium]|nr:PQQ-binding-like beta-propeller repeat protein [Pirellulales bacterium]